MKKLILASVLSFAVVASAKDAKSYEPGVLQDMNSVECGFEQKSSNTFVGEVLGTDSNKTKARKTFCHEYVLRTDHVIYRIRPRDDKHPALLPVGERALFRMKKDHMVLRVPEGDDKERDYDVLAMEQADKGVVTTAQSKR